MSSPVDLEALTANWTPQAKQRALEEYVARTSAKRQHWYCSKLGACGGKAHDGRPYPHARADQYPPGDADWFVWAILSGRGCVDPHTRIYDPDLDAHIPIAELGPASTVLTMAGPEEIARPFRKGLAVLWEVRLEDASRIVVTELHKFLTPAGWRPLRELNRGDLVSVSGASAYLTRSEALAGTIRLPAGSPGTISGLPDGHKSHYRTDFSTVGGAEYFSENLGSNFVQIDSIRYSHRGEYWDLTVPEAHHYSAEGIWNHNSGKTRTGAEWVRKVASSVERIGMVGRRGVDVRATMVEGDSGLIKVCEHAGIGWDWQPSKREFTFPSGAKVYGYSGEEPDSLRGPQHGAIWLDEPAHMPLIADVWDNILLGLRLPGLPGGAKALVTTTPLPTKWVKALEKDPGTRVVRASTYANLDNLDPTFRRTVLERFEGTRRGRQELYGEILTDVEGALWQQEMIHLTAVAESYDRIIIAIDPAGTANRRSDETGIVAAGKLGNEYHVLQDGTGKYSPQGWAEQAIRMYQAWKADAIVAEKNYGGDMVRTTIEHALELRRQEARIIVTTASRSKELRAEPVVGLYEQGRVWHVRDLVDLENEMLEWVPGQGASPNRVDALVWAITELSGGGGIGAIGVPTGLVYPRKHSPAQAAKDLIRGIFV